MTGGFIMTTKATSIGECVKKCHAISSCLSVNFKPNSAEKNCELLSNKMSSGTSSDVASWKYYEPVASTVRLKDVVILNLRLIV